MASTLGVEVIAEGVETEQQLTFLAEQGCSLFQGYGLGIPEALESFAGEMLT